MATRGPIVPALQGAQPPQVCDFCHQKAKFPNHQYCSKTCASQASSLCKYCHKKQKFQNFDYCGKNCAASAAAAGTASNPTQQQQAATVPKATINNPKPNAPKAFNPVQVAKFVVQQIPQVLGSSNGASTAPSTQPAGQAATAIPAAPPAPPSNNPFINLTNQPQQIAPNAGSTQAPANTQPPAPPLQCLIPGCGKPVHVDAQGNSSSDYCSRKHREEAVAIGLASPCIMCLTMPQSDTDYFCGKACREEALNKV